MLVVMRCSGTVHNRDGSLSGGGSSVGEGGTGEQAVQQRCVVINPHIEYDKYASGGRDTLYATNSLLKGARAGDKAVVWVSSS